MRIRITFKMWRKYKNEWMKREAECKIDLGRRLDNHNHDENTPHYSTGYVKRKKSKKLVKRIFPNHDIVTFKPQKVQK